MGNGRLGYLSHECHPCYIASVGNVTTDNTTAANALNSIDPKLAIILAVVAVMTTLMVWMLREARHSWDGATAGDNIHRVSLVFLYAGAIVLGLGSLFTTSFILLARRDFSKSELAYPVAVLMIAQAVLLMSAPATVTATLEAGKLASKQWFATYGRYLVAHLVAVVIVALAVDVLFSVLGPDPWTKMGVLNIILAGGFGVLVLAGESRLMWAMAGAQEMQKAKGGTTMAGDKNEIWHKQTVLTQRLAILLGINSILLLALANLDTVRYASLVKALPVIGVVVSVLSTIHLWLKKNDLERIDPQTGISKYAKGRWVAILLSATFCVIWGFAIRGAWR